mmetsp:Transcript_55268/g.82197  ORF Transcript_55268/g.82197 Transcript_55268/m.82197 type:complete len:86 (-) Transcript_55268:139-396(-)
MRNTVLWSYLVQNNVIVLKDPVLHAHCCTVPKKSMCILVLGNTKQYNLGTRYNKINLLGSLRPSLFSFHFLNSDTPHQKSFASSS